MLEALTIYGNDGTVVAKRSEAAFGRNLRKFLPEDDFDHGPIIAAVNQFMIVADTRIDNREDVAEALGLPNRRVSSMSDSELFCTAWEHWGDLVLDRLFGDFAFAIWDIRKKELILGRSAMSLKPLFFHIGRGFLAFSSMPVGLLTVAPKSINLPHAAAIASLSPLAGDSTIFEGVRIVSPGHLVRLGRDFERISRVWEPKREIVQYRRQADYGDRLREELDRAVRARLRHHSGRIAAHLSSGRDSSAVASSAATILADSEERLLALTAAPPSGFNGSVTSGWHADESHLAIQTAAMYDNVDHIICRADPFNIVTELENLHRLNHGPLLNPVNLHWWEAMNKAAHDRSASILLNGSFGNYALSAGGSAHLRDLVKENGIAAWLKTTIPWARLSPTKWRNSLNVTLAPAMTPRFYSLISKAAGRSPIAGLSADLLRPPYRQAEESRLKEVFKDPRPPNSYFDFRHDMLIGHDDAELMTVGQWGIEVRDPTADRRLVDYCFSIPSQQLVSAKSQRPAFDAAFRRRIPAGVISSRLRGFQTPEWYELYTQERVRFAFSDYGKNSIVKELIDLKQICRLIDEWPTGGWGSRSVLNAYRNSLLGTLALAGFIDVHFPD